MTTDIEHSIFLPSGFGHEFDGVPDPVDAFEQLIAVAHLADRSGYGTLWYLDHVLSVPPSSSSLFECWTTVSALARETDRIRIGQLVTGNGYRNPVLQAKMASTVDVLSHGRFTFGIGAGWYEPDYDALGIDFATAPTRLRRLGESLQVMLSIWTDERTSFSGEHYQVNDVVMGPNGVQRPHVPVLIAGAGEKITLKLVAQYGNACNIIDSPEGLAHKFAVLQRHCDDVGRDYDSIHRTAVTACMITDTDAEGRAALPSGAPFYPGDAASYCLVGTPDTIRARIADYAAAGVQELVVNFLAPLDLDQVRRYAEEFIA